MNSPMQATSWNQPLLLSLLAAAVLEEIVFRTGIQETLLRVSADLPLLRRRKGFCSAPNLATALVFALAHGLARSWWLGLAVIPPALSLGWLYERRRSLWRCIALHAAMNCAWFLAASRYSALS